MHRTAPGPPVVSPHAAMEDDDEMIARMQLGQYDPGGQPRTEWSGERHERERASEQVRETVGEADASDRERDPKFQNFKK